MASPREDFGVVSPASDSLTLLSVSYQHITSLSPDHPAMRDIDMGEGVGQWAGPGEGVEQWVEPGEGEPEIHKISVHCTGIDVMGKFNMHGT